MTKSIIILGPPGSGKGTQAKFFSTKYHLFYFGTGDLMRQEAEKQTAFGKKFQAIWQKGQGELIRDDLVDEFVYQKLGQINQSKGIIFDGYPRTIKQAENLSVLLKSGSENCVVFNIEVPADILIKRSSTRRVCRNCGNIFFEAERLRVKKCDSCGGELFQRQDDTPETIARRIEVYEQQTKPLIDYYKHQGILINIDGRPSISKVTKEMEKKFQEELKKA